MTGVEAKQIVKDAARKGKAVRAWRDDGEWAVSTRLGPWTESRMMTEAADARRVLGI